MNLKGRDFLKLLDFTPEEIVYLIDLAAELKDKKKRNIPVDTLWGKNVALIFEKTSTRTRCAFEVAAHDLGMGTTYLEPSASQIGKKESIADTAKVLSGMFEGIEYRGFEQAIVEELAENSKVPVWNGLTNEFHPTQMLADLLTIREHFGCLKGIKLTYMGDARYNMGNSLMVACAKMGMHFTACTLEKYFPAEELVTQCREIAAETGGSVTLTEDVDEGTKDVDVIYTDVWVSMGEPDEIWEERIRDLSPYKVDGKVMTNAGEKAIFLHCLPAFHDLKTVIGAQMGDRFGITEMEVTDEVFQSERSLVFEEAENRMHTIKAVMLATISTDSRTQKKRKVQVKIDPGLLEGKNLREVHYLPDREIKWLLVSEDSDINTMDDFVVVTVEEALEKFPEIKELMATESDRRIMFRKGRHSNKWYDFLDKA